MPTATPPSARNKREPTGPDAGIGVAVARARPVVVGATATNTTAVGVTEGVSVWVGDGMPVLVAVGVSVGGAEVGVGGSGVGGMGVATGGVMLERGMGPVGELTTAAGNGLGDGVSVAVGGTPLPMGVLVGVGHGFGVFVYWRVAVGRSAIVAVASGNELLGTSVEVGVKVGFFVGVMEGVLDGVTVDRPPVANCCPVTGVVLADAPAAAAKGLAIRTQHKAAISTKLMVNRPINGLDAPGLLLTTASPSRS